MAIAALSVGVAGETPAIQRARALGVAVRFAIGHALLLAIGAGALVALGWSLPLVVERGGEMLGGALLIVLGGDWPVGRRARDRSTATRTRTAHEPRRTGTCTSADSDAIRCRRAHSHLPTIIGAAFAVSSLRALTMLAPFGEGLASHRSPRC